MLRHARNLLFPICQPVAGVLPCFAAKTKLDGSGISLGRSLTEATHEAYPSTGVPWMRNTSFHQNAAMELYPASAPPHSSPRLKSTSSSGAKMRTRSTARQRLCVLSTRFQGFSAPNRSLNTMPLFELIQYHRGGGICSVSIQEYSSQTLTICRLNFIQNTSISLF